MKRKITAFLTAVIMLATLLPATAFAEVTIEEGHDIFFEAEDADLCDETLSTRVERIKMEGISGDYYARARPLDGAGTEAKITYRFDAPSDGLYKLVIYGSPTNIGYGYALKYNYSINDSAFTLLLSGNKDPEEDTATQETYATVMGNDLVKNTVKEYVPLQEGENILVLTADAAVDAVNKFFLIDCIGFTRMADIPEIEEALLWNLTVSGASLSPAFNAYRKEYTAAVPGNVESVLINTVPELDSYEVAVTYGDGDIPAPDGVVPLEFGENTVKVTVSDPVGGLPSNTYTIVITWPEATLSAINVNGSAISGFAEQQFAYALEYTSPDLGGSTAAITVDKTNEADTVQITNGDGSVVYEDGNVPLAEGENTIRVLVTGAATGAQNTYTLTIQFADLIRVEAEAAGKWNGPDYIGNFEYLTNAAATGGRFAGVTAYDPVKTGGYRFEFPFTIPEEGNYSFAAVTGPYENQYYSPYSIKIDDGPYYPVNAELTRESQDLGGSLFKYYYNLIETLSAGEHTLTLMWDTPTQANANAYTMWMDYVEIQETNTPPVPYAYPKKEQKPDMRITSDKAAYEGETVAVDKDADTYWQILRSDAMQQINADAAEAASVTFTVNAPETGDYIFRAATSAFDSAFYSPYEIAVNGTPVAVNYNALQEQKALLGLGADLTLYRYADITLNAGENTITFTPTGLVTAPGDNEGRKVFHVDYIELTNVNSTSMETVILPEVVLYDSAGEEMTEGLSGGEPFYIGSKMINMAQEDQELQIVAAVYNGGALYDMSIEAFDLPGSYEEADYVSQKLFTAPEALDNCEIKLFAWDGVGDMTPLAEPAKISNINEANVITGDYSDTMPGDEVKLYNDKDAVIVISDGKRQPTISTAYDDVKESDTIKQAWSTNAAADEYATYTYTVNVQEDGEYEFYTVANNYAGDQWVSPYTVSVNGEQLTLDGSTVKELEKLHNNNEFIRYQFPNLHLKAGDNTIQFRAVVNSQGWLSFRMDYVHLVKTVPATPTNFRINNLQIENTVGQPLKVKAGTTYYMGEPVLRGSVRFENHTAEPQTKALVLTYSEQGVEKQRVETEVTVNPGQQITVKTPFLRTERNENLLISDCEVRLEVLEGLKLPTPIKSLTAPGLFDFMQTQVPYYNSTIAYTESVTMLTGEDGGLPQAKLMYEPIEILSVRNATQDVEYIEGYDYYWDSDAQRLVLTEYSRAKYLTYEDVFVNLDENDAPGKDGLIYYDEQLWQDQLLVTYTHKANEISGWGQASPASSELPKTKAKLEAGEPVQIVAIGDSISAGSNSGANEGGYLDSFARLLQNSYESEITMTNLSQGGKTSDWGVTQAPAAAAYKPDLVILAFGTNDAYGQGMSVAQFRANFEEMIDTIRAVNPDAEFILGAGYLPNQELSDTNHTRVAEFRDAMAALADTGDDIALVDMQAVSTKMLEYKDYIDFSGSNRNHPNGYFHRWYAQMFASLLVK